ncbi:transferrin-binding protein-like solute binding protein [Aquabacterium sp.]|uniref:transferrin-binding protein-like solute binding protein n=1 Tax=Aquabacterium sp. TaxID=1872578 RepID=UPI0024878105|nr:transferrin-binding protein-like solute binding protein [Aquabacterium sp.]MDI1258999.1 transferrin-binding protein-like solute binding protein [Aquabacterium sp.]
MKYIKMLAISAASIFITACGGGGDANNEPPPSVKPLAEQSDQSARSFSIDLETQTTVSLLDSSHMDTIDGPSISTLIAADLVGKPSSIKINGGSVGNGVFGTPLVFQPTIPIPFSSKTIEINGEPTIQFKAGGMISTSGAIQYFDAALQIPSNARFKHAGMGNWKYVGDRQSGYWSGQKIAVGSFIFGKTTPEGTLPTSASREYNGVAQGAVEAGGSSYNYSFNQATMRANIYIDFSSKTVQISLTRNQDWGNNNNEKSVITSFMQRNYPETAIYDISCSGTIDTTTNHFSCAVAGQALSGNINGKLFGPTGTEVAGTYVLSSYGNQTIAGGFVAAQAP